MTNKKPDSFGDLESRFPVGVPKIQKNLVANRYALEIRNGFVKAWESNLNSLTAAKSINANELVVVEALESLHNFYTALENFRQLARPTNKRADEIDKLFVNLRIKMALIPGMDLAISRRVEQS
jgi:hypothetical protein